MTWIWAYSSENLRSYLQNPKLTCSFHNMQKLEKESHKQLDQDMRCISMCVPKQLRVILRSKRILENIYKTNCVHYCTIYSIDMFQENNLNSTLNNQCDISKVLNFNPTKSKWVTEFIPITCLLPSKVKDWCHYYKRISFRLKKC